MPFRKAVIRPRVPAGAQRRHGRERDEPPEKDLVAPHLLQKRIGPSAKRECVWWVPSGGACGARVSG